MLDGYLLCGKNPGKEMALLILAALAAGSVVWPLPCTAQTQRPIAPDTVSSQARENTPAGSDVGESGNDAPESSNEDLSSQGALDDVDSVTLEDVFALFVESASKKVEPLHDAPLTISVLRREEIETAGCSSIPEALRLLPGLIVREETRGNYQVHLRGLDTSPPGLRVPVSLMSTMTLVMIDYRPVYSYMFGGVDWEALPIGIADVERIEVVLGPASALYGPNAVTGVIHLITRRPKGEGVSVHLSGQADFLTSIERLDAKTAHGFVSYTSGPLALRLSADHIENRRFVTRFFQSATKSYVNDPRKLISWVSGEPVEFLDKRYPEPDLARRSTAGNLFLHYNPDEEVAFNASLGYQKSLAIALRSSLEPSPLKTTSSRTSYVDLRGRFHDARAQLSLRQGVQVTPMGSMTPHPETGDLVEGWGVDISILDAVAGYDLDLWSTADLRLEASYRRSQYSGLAVAAKDEQENITEPHALVENGSFSLGFDAQWLDSQLRTVVSGRLDYFPGRTEPRYYGDGRNLTITPSTPNPVRTKEGKAHFPTFEVATTLRLDDHHLIRATYGRAFRSPFFVQTFLDTRRPVHVLGNRAIDLVTSDAVEIGYRGRPLMQLVIDAVVFASYTRGFSEVYVGYANMSRGVLVFQQDDLPTKVVQYGLTLNADYGIAKTWEGGGFVTLQGTEIIDHVEGMGHDFEFDFDPWDKAYQSNRRHSGTPTAFGGAKTTYRPLPGLSLNATLYVISRHFVRGADRAIGFFDQAVYTPNRADIADNVLLNATARYRMAEGLELSLTGRNLLNMRKPEYFYGDKRRAYVMLGMHLTLPSDSDGQETSKGGPDSAP